MNASIDEFGPRPALIAFAVVIATLPRCTTHCQAANARTLLPQSWADADLNNMAARDHIFQGSVADEHSVLP